MRRGTRRIVGAIAGALFSMVLFAGGALACGTLVSEDGSAELGDLSALLVFDGTAERLVVTIDYSGASDGSGFAWLMPFPSSPEIAEADDSVIRDAVALTQPPERSDHVPSVVPLLCACGADTEDGGSTSVERTLVGDLEFSTLSSSSISDVERYLNRNGYAWHDRQREVVAGYLSRGWDLVAAKVRDGVVPAGTLASVSFDFAADEAVYPLAMAGSDHAGEPVGMSLVAVTPGRARSTTLPLDIAREDDDYVAADDGIELWYSAPATNAEANALGIEGDLWVSRIEASLAPEELEQDLVLAADPDGIPLDYSELLSSYRRDRYLVYGGRVLVTFLLVTPVVLFVGGAVVLLAGLVRGGFRKNAA